ncbi:MAG: thiamine phosphate synthase [Oligosphaeraceae bacterium]|nr:thiamine phosphate synthase [Oligosphaeraceae bacterium]
MFKFDPRLYLVTQRYDYSREEFLARVAAAICGGVTAVQLREKEAGGREFYELALALAKLCREQKVSFWINDRVDIALAAQADGVHVGQEDLPATVLRRIIPKQMLLGVSASTVDEAKAAEQAGADCVGCGAVFATDTKSVKLLSSQGLQAIRAAVQIPMLAIGGIKVANAARPIADGADGVAVVSAIMLASDTYAAAKSLRQVVDAALSERRSTK